MGDPAHRTRRRIEGEGNDADLGARQLRNFRKPLVQVGDLEAFGKLAHGRELRARAERGEGRVAEIDPGREEMVRDRRDEADPVPAEDRYQRHRSHRAGTPRSRALSCHERAGDAIGSMAAAGRL